MRYRGHPGCVGALVCLGKQSSGGWSRDCGDTGVFYRQGFFLYRAVDISPLLKGLADSVVQEFELSNHLKRCGEA